MEQVSAIQLRGITKRFGSVVANDGIDLEVRRGEILSLLGENGSGKTTLMNMISGIYFPDEGHIQVGGREVTIRSPKDAYALGIGMIHQHFKLVDVFTAAQNIVLGLEGKGAFDLRAAARRVKEISEKYGFDIDPGKKVYDMSVSEKQTVEILKVLYRGADILILDEPTAVLTPQETEKLFAVLRNMRADGKAIVIITHKLHEVMALSDRVAVLRKGKYIGTVHTADTDPQKLTEMMVGREIDSTPTVLMTAYPVRGLDINSSYTIYGLLNQQKMKGVAVLLVGEDLDVLLELCDRILVLCGGKVSGIVDGRNTTKEEVGLYMTHVGGGKEAGERA